MAVYFVRSIETDRIKVGYTYGSVNKRLCTMQTGSPEKLELLLSVPNAGRYEESWIHRRFKETRIHGEWFKMDEEMKIFIRAIKSYKNPAVAICLRPNNPLEQEQERLLRKEKEQQCQHA